MKGRLRLAALAVSLGWGGWPPPAFAQPSGEATRPVRSERPGRRAPAVETPKPGPGTERDEDCLVCHAGVGEEDAPKVSLDRYRATVHGEIGCIGCHVDVENPDIAHEEEDEDLAPPDCAVCHATAGAVHLGSVHALPGPWPDVGEPTGAQCFDCHGNHAILPSADPDSRLHPSRQAETCGTCHAQDRGAGGHEAPLPFELDGTGTLPKAACTDCHAAHAAVTAGDPASRLHRTRIARTCETCHAKQVETYRTSAHAAALADPKPDAEHPAPVCSSCHPVHGRSTLADRTAVANDCGECHAEQTETYRQSYHGVATELGAAAPAKCSDCHGAHRILPSDEPASTVGSDNRADTCRRCHADASDGFASYVPHADPHDWRGHPGLFVVQAGSWILLVSVTVFFGLFLALVAMRVLVDRLRGRPAALAPPPALDRAELRLHHVVAAAFVGLGVTGVPLVLASRGWATEWLAWPGAVEIAGWVHGGLGLVVLVALVVHAARMTLRLWPAIYEGRLLEVLLGPATLLPGWADAEDATGWFAWAIGLRQAPPRARWSFQDRFDYWAVIWGVIVLGSTGFILWMPELVTWVLPGWVVNIALLVHSTHALLALGFLFGVHAVGARLRKMKRGNG